MVIKAKYTIAVIVLFYAIIVQSQEKELYSVIAKNGLSIRNAPSINSEKIGKLLVGEDVTLLEKTGEFLSVEDNGQNIDGHWFKIHKKDILTKEITSGYVFSGYLLKKQTNYLGMACDAEKPCKSVIPTTNFDIVFYNYQIEAYQEKQDTIIAHEYVFNQIGDKLLHIIPKKPIRTIKVSHTFYETLNRYEQEAQETPKWSGFEPYKLISSTNSPFFRIPKTEHDIVMEKRIKKMGLEKPADFSDQPSGDVWWVPRLLYKDKKCIYEVTAVFLKIEVLYHDNTTETKTVQLFLSYGC